MSRMRRTARLCFDVILFVLVCFADYALHKWSSPSRRGFFCDDETLQYPYRENTISVWALVAIVLSMPSLVIVVTELCRPHTLSTVATTDERKSQTQTQTQMQTHSIAVQENCSGRLGQRLVRCYAQIGYYLFGLALTVLATEVSKYSVGRLRPHFFAVCQPQLHDGSSCADEHNRGRYIEQYNCAAPNSTAKMLEQLGQSFPSGHASIFFYAMLYLCLYLHGALGTGTWRLLRHLLQFVCVLLAWYVSLTRIADHWHHWTDVLAGALLGCVLAVLIACAQPCAAAVLVPVSSSRAISSTVVPPSGKVSATTPAANSMLPAYTFGSIPYLQHAHPYGQTYHNYGYVP